MEEIEALRRSIKEMETMYKNFGDPRTLVVGCGGAGINFVDYFHGLSLSGVTTVGINTDQAHLSRIKADKRMFIGKEITKGRGAGGHKEIGVEAAESADEALREILEGSDIVFLIAGMGGGTGLGATPVVGRIAKEVGAVVIGIAIMPFPAEMCRCERASEGLSELKKVAESTIVLDNNRLLEIAPHLSTETAMNVMNKMISEVIISTKRTLTQTIKAASSMEFMDVLGSFSQTVIEEVEEQEVDQRIIPNLPLHANLTNEHNGQTDRNLECPSHPNKTTELIQ